jgi:hypothetical protein
MRGESYELIGKFEEINISGVDWIEGEGEGCETYKINEYVGQRSRWNVLLNNRT